MCIVTARLFVSKQAHLEAGSMMTSKLATAAIFAAGLGFAGAAWAVPIQVTFNFVPCGRFTANTGDISNATTISGGQPYQVTTITTNNIGLISTAAVILPNIMPVTLNSVFSKVFSTP